MKRFSLFDFSSLSSISHIVVVVNNLNEAQKEGKNIKVFILFFVCEGGNMKRDQLLSEFTIRQFDVKKFNEMIRAFLELIADFQLMLDDDTYCIKLNDKDEMKINYSQKPTNSKVESLAIKKYDNDEKIKELISKYPIAYNALNELERKVFRYYYIDQFKDIVVLNELSLYTKKLQLIRKSAIVKFSLKLGFHKLDY